METGETPKPYGTIDKSLERITPYDEGLSIEQRIDEIVQVEPTSIHLEMMNEKAAWMRIGSKVFDILVEKGELIVRFREDENSTGVPGSTAS